MSTNWEETDPERGTSWQGSPAPGSSAETDSPGQGSISYNTDRIQGRFISPNAPSDGQGLVWSAALGIWLPGSVTATIPFAAPTASVVGDVLAEGSANSAARSDHLHGRENFGLPAPSGIGDTGTAGTALTLSRSDHKHARENFGSPVASAPGNVNADGSALTPARSDHVHAREFHGSAQHGSLVVDHGSIGGLSDDDHTQYARKDLVTTKGDLLVATGTSILARLPVGVNGKVLKADSAQATGLIWSDDLTGTGVTFGSPTASAVGDVSGDGVSTNSSRADHRHARENFGAPGNSSPGNVAAAGSAATVARSDHLHGRENHGATEHTDYTRKDTLTAKGDLYVATAAGTLARLPVGVDGLILRTDSTQTTGLIWGADQAGGGGVTFGSPGASSVGDTIAAGSSVDAARTDHRHGRESFAAPGASSPGDAVSAGVATTVPRSDHVHSREAHGLTQHGSTIVDHGSIAGLADDDHTQYLNNTRGDARYPLKSLVTAKADLLVATGSGVLVRQPVGADGQVLTADSTLVNGVKWAAASGGGVTFAAPGSSAPSNVIAEGVSTSAARADHTHGRESYGASVVNSFPGDTGSAGVSASISRMDHRHGREKSTPIYITRSAFWIVPGGGSGTIAMVLNTLYAVPFIPDRAISIDALAVNVTVVGAAGAIVRTGIYDSDAVNYPAFLRTTSEGTHDATVAGVKERVLAAAQALDVGTLYWLVAVTQAVTSTLRGSGFVAATPSSSSAIALGTTSVKGYSVTGITGVLPATFPTAGLVSATITPGIAARVV